MPKINRTIVVAGDEIVDRNIVHHVPSWAPVEPWNPVAETRLSATPGGAALLGEMITGIARDIGRRGRTRWQVFAPTAPAGRPDPAAAIQHQSFAIWKKFEITDRAATSPRVETAWRMYSFLGLDRAVGGARRRRVAAGSGSARTAGLVVINDAGLGFGDDRSAWPAALSSRTPPRWVLLKVSRQVCQNPLWNHVGRHHAERTIAVVPIEELRASDVQSRPALSWESAVEDLVWELARNPCIRDLARCAAVVIPFDNAGALLVRRRADGVAVGHLVFDPSLVEGEWGPRYPGHVTGGASCMLVALARACMLAPEQPNLIAAISAGLAARRALHRNGYAEEGEGRGRLPVLRFPTARLVAEFRKRATGFASVTVPIDGTTPAASRRRKRPSRPDSEPWSILAQQHALDREQQVLLAIARDVARRGVDAALPDVPIGHFGHFVSVDRHELEALRATRNTLAQYVSSREQRPLSIAVFGPPGAGKSFVVKQLIASAGIGSTQAFEFNLSQFRGPQDLVGAFHRLRDASLSGALPIAFWDEFDAGLDGARLGWLAHFLAPMQDGKFLEGQITHPIGRSIFIFAGGTAHRHAEFGADKADKEFRDAKGPDFISRLRGTIDVLGPNPSGTLPGADRLHVLRRAILLRALLRDVAPRLFRPKDGYKDVLQIDESALRAFLETRTYRHGARSMEAVIRMSNTGGRSRFERSSLPARGQLDLHVSAAEFQARMQQPTFTGELLERLAQATHQIFCENKKREGWRRGAEKSKARKTHPRLVSWRGLPEAYKESNRVNVRAIPEKLAAIGCVLTPARAGLERAVFSDAEIETMAQREHEIWMAAKLVDGWRLGKETAEDPKGNECLVPWSELVDDIKRIDRDFVREIPRIAAEAGYSIVRS